MTPTRWRWAAAALLFASTLIGAEVALRARYRQQVYPRSARAPAARTVVALGDSIVAGGWPERLAEHLTAEAATGALPWRVLNAGVPGDTAPRGYARFERDVAAAGPQIVLIAFGLNDCAPGRYGMDGALEDAVPRGPQRSYLWQAAERRVRAVGERIGLAAAPMPEAARGAFPRVSPEGFATALAALVARTQEIGARPVLLTMTPLADWPAAGVTARAGAYAATNQIVRQVAARHGLPLVELASGAPLGAWEADGFHLSALGQAWVADEIYRQLVLIGLWSER